MTDLIPHSSFQSTVVLPRPEHATVLPGQAQGVSITLHPDAAEQICEKMARWFTDRSEVVIVDEGTSDKQGFGFLIIEWIEHAIDPLFLAILREEEVVGDYTVYGRVLEGA